MREIGVEIRANRRSLASTAIEQLSRPLKRTPTTAHRLGVVLAALGTKQLLDNLFVCDLINARQFAETVDAKIADKAL